MILEAYDCGDNLLMRVSGEPGALVFETFEPHLPKMIERHRAIGLVYLKQGPEPWDLEQVRVRVDAPDYLEHLAPYLRSQGGLTVVTR